ncbi:MAG: tRNA uridine-5-carboxymethylaminomethyl(34) synthesis GTPase MnmE [Runella slithyformis]|nr:MAG: tRNA uridine-5-carboxymethylaminomethyl(34) synthesis GTPase MnmE [Runella slithyformis]TAF23282.1 MAG: tRNA uridine-5-carboxymethylaminomethyl(34) synthesis GTPase MnmE [Runella slithyformis]TAF45710.1 MAG: tRNA uridine-5-carboxymethylaminomethyl(34) synthesis GTPase MnmE [Runella slithyformis]TAF81099.1 MAG: tRNA uridine-5-carboxymethylaminomethyl(34) synthesis GTPase MnmE [Runella slithyformis]
MVFQQEPICAVATPAGVGALGIIRVSGAGAVALTNGIFSGKDLTKVESHTVHFGTIRVDNAANPIIDEVLVSIFKSPRSFTKEDVVEISCHGSDYIIRQILQVLVKNGARLAKPGEFTQRAFLNGQFDLVQAEAVADLIAADSAAAHHSALTQLRGGFSKQLATLRQELIHFASLIELELDFGEEDVEFANRDDLKNLIAHLQSAIAPLIASFNYGNALKEGIPVAIIGAPNVGKSTLLNTLLNEEKAIVTPIAGTTRDIIEDILFIDGLKFRIIDTAGIRQTDDLVESMGIERSKRAMNQADVVVLIYDDATTLAAVSSLATDLEPTKKLIWVQNKIDQKDSNELLINEIVPILISAKTGVGIENLKSQITQLQINPSQTVVTNLRHYEHLLKTNQALADALMGLENNITGDFLAQDIRLSLHHLGEITGQIVNDDLLANIFSKFCIGK